ncbi:MAG: BACON domain-containing carbohydrate-binding protein, partial [Acidobacteriota bacterium]
LVDDQVLVNVPSLLVNGGTIFAGTSRSVYRSTDNGATWTAAKTGLPGSSVLALVVTGNTLFASDFGNGVYRSTDNGATWTAAKTGLTEPFIRCLLISGNTLYAGSDLAGVFGSTDNGNTWTERGLLNGNIFTLANSSGGTVIAGTYNSIYRTADGGTNWTRISSGLSNLWVYSVTILGNSIFTGTDDGVYRSTDNGSSWVRTGLKDRVVSAVGVAGNSIIASNGGLTFRSADNGASWTDISSFFGFGQTYEIVAVGNAYLAASDNGLFRSTDSGATWVNYGVKAPMSSAFLDPLDGLAVNGQFVFAGSYNTGVYRSSDGGANWTLSSNGLPQDQGEYYPVGFIASGNNVVFVGNYQGGLSRSIDNGANWVGANNGLQGATVDSVVFSGNAFYAGTKKKGVFRSTDNGASWSPSGLSNLRDVFAIAGNGSTLFAATTEGAFVLAEAALAWTESNNGLANRFINTAVYDTNSFLLGTNDGGVYRSTDDGKNWQPANSGLPPAAAVRALIKTASGSFVGIPGSGVYFSSDQGQTWVARNNGLGNNQINALAADGTTLFAGTEGGVFRSSDAGANWTAINNGLTRLRVLALTASSAGILAGTDSGLFRFTTASSTWSAANTGLTDQYIVSLGFAPNGTNLLAGTSSGLFLSTNQGQNWTRVDRGIAERVVVFNLLVAGNKLLAGTVNGFYISDDNGTSWVVNNTGLLNPQVSALAVKGSLVAAGTRNSGVFLSQIPDLITNHPPAVAFSCQTSLSTTVGGSVSCTVTRSDPDGGQTTTLSAGGILDGAQFNPATGAFSWTPLPTQAGVHFVTFTGTDNGNPRLASSRDLTITVNSAVPQLSSLNPSSRPAATGDFLVSVVGNGFVQGSRVRWNGTNRPTDFVSANQLSASIPAADVLSPGSANITVSNPAPGGGLSNSLTFTITAPCSYSINPTSRTINAAGGTGSVTLNTGAGCPWETINSVSWLQVTSASAGTGNATVNYSVQSNATGAQRIGTITIAGQNLTVTQGAGTELSVDDGTFEQTLGITGGGTVAGINRLTPGTYPATLYGISIPVPAYPGITNGKAFTLLYGSIASTQPDINTVTLQTLNATVQSVGNFFVYTIPELTINSGDFLLGFRMTHAANEGPLYSDRNSGSKRRSYYQSASTNFVLIDSFDGFAGNFGIRARSSVGCAPNLASTSQSFAGAGGTGSLGVTGATGCTWSAFSNVPWLTITSGVSGTGNANANYSVVINLTTAARSGTLTIAGRTFTVTQAAGLPELALDDGSAETAVASGNGSLSAVNRFTPPVYPLTVTGISIALKDIAAGRAMTLLIGTVSSGAANLNGLTFQEINTTTQAPGDFRIYTIPNQTINSGDVVLGVRFQHAAGEFPVQHDTTLPSKNRSFFFNGTNYILISSFPNLDGNFLIRARVIPPATFGEELEPATISAGPQGTTVRNPRLVPQLQSQPINRPAGGPGVGVDVSSPERRAGSVSDRRRKPDELLPSRGPQANLTKRP